MKLSFSLLKLNVPARFCLASALLSAMSLLPLQPNQFCCAQQASIAAPSPHPATESNPFPHHGTPPPEDCCFLPYLGTHYYDVFLQDYLIGRATVEVGKSGDEYQVRVNAKTRSVLNALYKIRYKGEVILNTNPLVPHTAVIEENTGSKTKKYEMEFAESDRVTVIQTEQKGSKPPQIKEKEFVSERFVFDPFSTVYLIRSIDWKTGLSEIFDVVTGNKHYELLLTCTGTTTLTMNDEKRAAWIVRPQIRNLAKKPSLREPATWSIYVSQDAMREILRIDGHPKIGRIVAQMRKFEKLF